MNRFLISDHHFGHNALYGFLDEMGERVRPWADDAEAGDEAMIEAHNAIVKSGDTVYFGGDVAIKRRALPLVGRMNGRKILIRGNHDIFKLKDYAAFFADVRASHLLDKVILSHYPIHPGSLPSWCLGNAHGHTHQNNVLTPEGGADPRYLNLCVEVIGLSPIPIETVVQRLLDSRPCPNSGFNP